MIAKARSISHGSAMTNYVTKHNRADIVLTRNLGEELTPLAMWGAMETIHQRYAPKFRRKPIKNPTLRLEVSPSFEETKGWTLNDWYQYALWFLEEFQKGIPSEGNKKKSIGKINLEKAQLFACLHNDAKSGIPHLHIIINRIDLDGNLINDSFIGKRATWAANSINVERGWELPEDIHDAHLKEITDVCYDILRKMPRYDWERYKRCLESRSYKVHEQRDKQGILHAYTIHIGNSRFKSSTLGKSRNLTASRLESTWKSFHPVAQNAVKPSSTVATSTPTERVPLITKYHTDHEKAVQAKMETPVVFTKLLSVDNKDYSIYMPIEAYKAMNEAFGTQDESVPRETALNVAMLLFMNYVDAATSMSESCGGGGGTSSGWCKDKDENECDWARRCALLARWLCKPLRRNKGQGR